MDKNEIIADLQKRREEEEEKLVRYLAKGQKIEHILYTDVRIEVGALIKISEKDSRKAMCSAFKIDKKILHIAARDPNGEELKKVLKNLESRGYQHKLYYASTKTLKSFWEHYKDIKSTTATSQGKITITNEELEELLEKVNSLDDVIKILDSKQKRTRTGTISNNVEYIVGAAIAIKSSDIHTEYTRDGGIVRYRIDGVLKNVKEMDINEMNQLVTRLKLVSGMKINVKNKAQDGAFDIKLNERTLRIRASTIPEGVGESFVLRILDPLNVIHNIEDLGLHPLVLKVFRQEINKPNGMIITTGPTGSGKTTTLYSFLNSILNPDIKIITLEDPVEYKLSGIVQTQISKDYSFASGLRAVLRQDPDVILVGEIRDEEVAETAINSALTGHLVFSTLHTNDALGVIPRLIHLKVKADSIPRAINMIISQRLVRRVCKNCAEKHELNEKEKGLIEDFIKTFPKDYKENFDFNNIKKAGKGCNKCNDGYKGRIGVYELFLLNEEIENAINKGAFIKDLSEAIKKQGLPTIQVDCVWKVLKGITTFSEAKRVVDFNL